jgi:hypothetical protein
VTEKKENIGEGTEGAVRAAAPLPPQVHRHQQVPLVRDGFFSHRPPAAVTIANNNNKVKTRGKNKHKNKNKNKKNSDSVYLGAGADNRVRVLHMARAQYHLEVEVEAIRGLPRGGWDSNEQPLGLFHAHAKTKTNTKTNTKGAVADPATSGGGDGTVATSSDYSSCNSAGSAIGGSGSTLVPGVGVAVGDYGYGCSQARVGNELSGGHVHVEVALGEYLVTIGWLVGWLVGCFLGWSVLVGTSRS